MSMFHQNPTQGAMIRTCMQVRTQVHLGRRFRDGRAEGLAAWFINHDRRQKMRRMKKVALFDHPGCQTKFFARLDSSVNSHKYRGRCPNPRCNRTVSLFPEVMFTSMDKARREYIKLTHTEIGRIYWQT